MTVARKDLYDDGQRAIEESEPNLFVKLSRLSDFKTAAVLQKSNNVQRGTRTSARYDFQLTIVDEAGRINMCSRVNEVLRVKMEKK